MHRKAKPCQGLVQDLPSHKKETTIFSAIVGVAHDLKIAVCADGVETLAQLDEVKGHGCDFAQGFLLSSPLQTNEMEQLIAVELAQ